MKTEVRPIDLEAFHRTLKINKKLLYSKDADFVQWAFMLDKRQWPEEVNSELTFSDTEVRKLSIRHQPNNRHFVDFTSI
jgi:hypothetical protein